MLDCDFFCFQAEGGIRDLVRSRGLGDVYKRQSLDRRSEPNEKGAATVDPSGAPPLRPRKAHIVLFLSLIHI